MPTKRLARLVHSRGDGLSSPWGGVVALRWDQDVVAIASISLSPAKSRKTERGIGLRPRGKWLAALHSPARPRPYEILSLRLRLMPIGRILAAALALG